MPTLAELRQAKKAKLIKNLSLQIDGYKSQGLVYRAWLFGSYAKDTWDGGSDVDILCVTDSEKHQIPLIFEAKEIDIIVINKDKLNAADKNPYLLDILSYGIEL